MDYQLVLDDFIGSWGYSKQFVRGELSKHAEESVSVRISSLGGDLDHGLDIYRQFVDHGDVTVYLTGFVASAATVIAMGAKRICMSKYALFLVHKCSNFVDAWGNYNADEMQDLIDRLTANKQENDKIDVMIAQLYAKRCGKSVADMLGILKEGRWLTAEEALDFGFIDEIIEEREEKKQNLTESLLQKFNAFGLPTKGLVREEKENGMMRMLRQILDFLKGGVPAAEAPAPAKEASTPEPKPTLMDNTDHKHLMDALGVETLASTATGEITLTAEQLASLDSLISNLRKEVETKTAEAAELSAQVETLKNLPGDDTKGNLDATVPSGKTEEEMYQLAKSFID